MNLLKPPCPCGDERCRAFGPPTKATGHAKHCWEGCPVCARSPKPQSTSRKIPQSVRRQVRTRSGGRCEVVMPSGRCEFDADHMHHRRMRSQGGQDTERNLLDVCHEHHQMIHDQPAWAMEHGYLLGNEPLSLAVTSIERVSSPRSVPPTSARTKKEITDAR